LAIRVFEKSRIGKLLSPIILIGFLLAVAWLAVQLEPSEPDISGSARASDGDSLHLGPDRVRLLGIDAPELAQTCWDENDAVWPCGRQARDRMTALLRSGTLICSPEGRDRFDRLLAHCTINGKDLGAQMVSGGWAIATDGYGAEEATARRGRRGIWQGRFETPRTWRDQQGEEGQRGFFDGFFGIFDG
jgi:endonuclease YncB( thermonuclease family)